MFGRALAADPFFPQALANAGLLASGRGERGKAASLLVLQEDPVESPMTLSAPVMVFHSGERLR